MIREARTYLWRETLEERANTLRLDHFLDDGATPDSRVEVGVLDTCLDDVEGSSDRDGSDGTSDGSDKVCPSARLSLHPLYASGQKNGLTLSPCSLRVVGQLEKVLFHRC